MPAATRPAAVGPARVAFEWLTARYAGGLRGGSAVAAAVAAFVGLAPPASTPLVGLAVAGLLAWTGGYVAVALTRGWTRWLVGVDILVAVGLCLGHRALVPAAVLPDGSSWVFVVASTTVIVSQLNPRPLLGVAATVLVAGAHAGGLVLAGRNGPFGFTVVLAVQGALVGSLIGFLRRAGRAADAAIADREAVERDAALLAARRAEEREHYRLLHDSVSATLTVVSAGGVTAGSPGLRAQARRDLAVIERIQTAAAHVGDDAGGDLARWLAPLAGPASGGVLVESTIDPVPVPDAVGAAFAGAVAEALANVARHADVARARLRAGSRPDGVRVELADDGRGFYPAAVPAYRRGLRESVVGRMQAVGGTAAVSSRPGGGTRIVLTWPAGSGATPDPAGPPGLAEEVAARYRRGFELAVVWLVGLWYLGGDLFTTIAARPAYRSAAAEVVAAVLMTGVGAAGAVRLLRHRADPATSRLLAVAALVAGAVGSAAVPGSAIFTANWAFDATGWVGVLLLLRRPLVELGALLAVNAGFTLAVLLYDGAADRVTLARFATVAYATTALQLAVVLAARALDAMARRAVAAAQAGAAVRRRRQVAEHLHAGRRDRYQTVRRSVAPVLAGLASGELDPADPRTQHRCAVGASRLRRLFAETDDVPDPLLHELRACADVADRRGVLVDLHVQGRLPALDVSVRRALAEAPMHALSGARRQARVTVVARADEVAVSVLADGRPVEPVEPARATEPLVTVTVQEGGDRQWVETRWRRG